MPRDKTWQIKRITDLDVVRAVHAYRTALEAGQRPPRPYEAIAAETGCPEKVAYLACERAYYNRLIEYGVSLPTGWLTDKGRALLADGEISRTPAA